MDRSDRASSARSFLLPAAPLAVEGGVSALVERALWRRSLLASALFHTAILAALLLLWRPFPPPEAPVIKVMLLAEGPGAAGAQGGDAGGGGEAAEAATPPEAESPNPAETTPAEAVPETPRPEIREEATPPPPAAKPLREPEPPPPPRRKPKLRQARVAPPLAPAPPAPTEPEPKPAQLAAAPLPVPLPGTTGMGGGPGAAQGVGQGAQGQGQGVEGNGPDGPGDDYLDRVRRWINRFKTYPPEASKLKEEGTTILDVTLARDGTVLAVEVERSSGFPLLDEAAVKAVHDASPVPPFPAAYRAERGTMVVPALYRLGVFDRLF
jgi:periplasmic protein TonB